MLILQLSNMVESSNVIHRFFRSKTLKVSTFNFDPTVGACPKNDQNSNIDYLSYAH